MPDASAVDLYGIANCDQVRRARTWLKDKGIAVAFHDFKREPPSRALVSSWLAQVPWDALVNQRGTTWRQLEPKHRPCDRVSAITAVLASPSLIKRPVLDLKGQLLVGFEPDRYQALFG